MGSTWSDALTQMVAANAALGMVLPLVLQCVTRFYTDNRQKANAAWLACLIVAVVMAGANGAFAPVAEAWRSGVSSGGMLAALWKSGVLLAGAFGTLVTVASQMYDKFYKPALAAMRGEIGEPPIDPERLQHEQEEALIRERISHAPHSNTPHGPVDEVEFDPDTGEDPEEYGEEWSEDLERWHTGEGGAPTHVIPGALVPPLPKEDGHQ